MSAFATNQDRPLRRAVSLIELLVSVVVLGVIASATTYSFANTAALAREQAAHSRAEILDVGRRMFGLTRPNAHILWSRAPAGGRLALLLSAGVVDARSDFLVLEGGYELVLDGDLLQPTRILKRGVEVRR